MKHFTCKPMLHLLHRVVHFWWQCRHLVCFSCGSTRWSNRSYLESTCSVCDSIPAPLMIWHWSPVERLLRDGGTGDDPVIICELCGVARHFAQPNLYSDISEGSTTSFLLLKYGTGWYFGHSGRRLPCFRCRHGQGEVVWRWYSFSSSVSIW